MSTETETFHRRREDQIADLATGFALGELDEDELRRFYDLLKEPGAAGADAARIAWQVLGTTVDLRASLGTRLQDTVRHRVDGGDEDATGGGFIGGVMARLGFERRTLGSVRIPVPKARYRFPWLIAVLGVAIGIVVAAVGALGHGSEPLATVVAVHGAVTREGSFVGTDQIVDQRPVVLSQAASLTLRWEHADGHAEVQIVGPAKVVPQADGLSLLSGRCVVSTLIPFGLGLPDRQVSIAAHSEVAAEVHDARSQLGVESGLAHLGSDTASGSEIRAGQAVAGGGEAFRWVASRQLRGSGPTRHLDSDPSAPSWQLSFTVTFTAVEDRIELSTADGQTALTFAPGKVAVDVRGEQVELDVPGPPLRGWRVHLQALPGSGMELRVDEAQIRHQLPDRHLPTVVHFSGGAGISALQHHTGPEPLR